MKVARMAALFGKQYTPHISGGLVYLYMMHFVSAIPNAGHYHEFKGFTKDLPFECITSQLTSDERVVTVPSGLSLGIELDPEYIAKHQLVRG
jgi:L-alanine-DL-glutamate epimerase-like enolase superfamily enzyme